MEDAYWVGRTAGRFWQLIEGTIEVADLSELEARHFTAYEKFVRGKKAGKVKRKGITYKENDRFFKWSEN